MKHKTPCSWIISFAISSCIKSLTFHLQLSTLLPIQQSFWNKVWLLLAFSERKEVGVFWLSLQGWLSPPWLPGHVWTFWGLFQLLPSRPTDVPWDAKLMAKGWRGDDGNLLPSQLGECLICCAARGLQIFGHLIWRSQKQNESRIEPVLLCSHTWT